jgi:hypothetical protein
MLITFGNVLIDFGERLIRVGRIRVNVSVPFAQAARGLIVCRFQVTSWVPNMPIVGGG